MARGDFLRRAGNLAPLGLSHVIRGGRGLTFALLSGWTAYAVAVVIVVASLAAPIFFFGQGIVFPFFGPVAVAWLSCAGAATYQHFFVRRHCGGLNPRSRAISKPSTGPRTKCARR